MDIYSTETICALSTPPGMGAIAIIRISGPQTFMIIGEIFHSAEKGFDISNANSHTIHLGNIFDGDKQVDTALISLFRKPRSYTGEDVIEISCHGSVYIQQKIMELLIRYGARAARPGEFTLRAFLNGKYDLTQAEAVADLIASHAPAANDLALKQMRGGFSKEINLMRQKLVEFSTLIELELDFSEEHAVFADRAQLIQLLEQIRNETSRLIESFKQGNVIKYGIPVAIIGKPNVGKSTLLNAILNEERAIVSEIPGTTRDSIEDTIVIGGYTFRFIDTAGLRESRDHIESLGIERTRNKIREASIILYIFDAAEDTFEEVVESIKMTTEPGQLESKHLIIVGNKTDLLDRLPGRLSDFMDYKTIFVSAKRKENIHLIAESLHNTVSMAEITDKTLVSNVRHYEALLKTKEAIEAVLEGILSGVSTDLLTVDMRRALYYLGEITGEITTDEILGNIFKKFCLGK